jgi:N-acetylmuramoyl-L-alanine amidase
MKDCRRMVGIALAITIAAAGPAAATELGLRWADGRRAAPIPIERLAPESDEFYVSANALAEVLALERFWRPEARKLVLVLGERRVQVTVGTRLVLDGDNEVLLRENVLYRRGSVMLPLEFLERVLVPHLGAGARFERRELELIVGRTTGDVAAVEYEPGPDGTRVRVRLLQPVQYRAQATSRQLVRVRLEGAQIDPVALAADRPAPLVRSLRAEQSAGAALLYFELEPGAGGFLDRSDDGGRTIILDLQRGAAAGPAVATAGQAPRLRLMPDAADSLDVVVLDPGHGGFDRGARAGGLDEPDVTLQLAQALRPILERDLGVRVVLTRESDATLSAGSRAELANRAGGDVLLSLHCNAWYDPHASGFEVLYAPLVQSTAADAALASARRGVTDFVPWGVAHMPYVEQSRTLAQAVAAALESAFGGMGRGVRAADLDVVHGATMPAIAIELGFLTNADDRRRLGDHEFPAKLGAALASALRARKRTTERQP